jgi:hypothetical protein
LGEAEDELRAVLAKLEVAADAAVVAASAPFAAVDVEI